MPTRPPSRLVADQHGVTHQQDYVKLLGCWVLRCGRGRGSVPPLALRGRGELDDPGGVTCPGCADPGGTRAI